MNFSQLPPPLSPPPLPASENSSSWWDKVLQWLHLTTFSKPIRALILCSFFVGFLFFSLFITVLAEVIHEPVPAAAPSLTAVILAGDLAVTPSKTAIPSPALTPTLMYFSSLTATSGFTSTITLTATATFTPTATLTPTVTLPAINQASCIDPSAQRQTGIVTQVMDGNTIHVQIDGKDYVVRYIGIAVPEAGAAGATAATSYNSQLLMGKPVTLIRDVSETDAGGRLLRYVLVENVFVNYVLVSHGLAVAKSDSLDTACDQVFVDAQKQAKVNQMGLWLPTITPVPYVPPIVVPTPTAANLSNGGNCDPSYPTVCIPPPPPDLDCKDIPYRRFRVLPPDPHHFDGDHDGIGCET